MGNEWVRLYSLEFSGTVVASELVSMDGGVEWGVGILTLQQGHEQFTLSAKMGSARVASVAISTAWVLRNR